MGGAGHEAEAPGPSFTPSPRCRGARRCLQYQLGPRGLGYYTSPRGGPPAARRAETGVADLRALHTMGALTDAELAAAERQMGLAPALSQ